MQTQLNSRDLRVVKVNFVGNFNHNSGIPDLTNGPTLGVEDKVEDVVDILVEVGVTENILAEEGVTLFVDETRNTESCMERTLSCI